MKNTDSQQRIPNTEPEVILVTAHSNFQAHFEIEPTILDLHCNRRKPQETMWIDKRQKLCCILPIMLRNNWNLK